jgi:hypothetical protein
MRSLGRETKCALVVVVAVVFALLLKQTLQPNPAHPQPYAECREARPDA